MRPAPYASADKRAELIAAATRLLHEQGFHRTTLAHVADSAKVLILATKPDQVGAVLAEISGAFTKKHLLISIAAGVTLAKLEAALPPGARVIRVM